MKFLFDGFMLYYNLVDCVCKVIIYSIKCKLVVYLIYQIFGCEILSDKLFQKIEVLKCIIKQKYGYKFDFLNVLIFKFWIKGYF